MSFVLLEFKMLQSFCGTSQRNAEWMKTKFYAGKTPSLTVVGEIQIFFFFVINTRDISFFREVQHARRLRFTVGGKREQQRFTPTTTTFRKA